MKIEKKFWKNKKVLITGHTGFKGGWLSVILNLLGSKVSGCYFQALLRTTRLDQKQLMPELTDTLPRKHFPLPRD